jgi:hypothetical protein
MASRLDENGKSGGSMEIPIIYMHHYHLLSWLGDPGIYICIYIVAFYVKFRMKVGRHIYICTVRERER